MEHFFLALVLGFVVGCGSEATQAPEGRIDPLTGLDTTQVLITPAELAATDSIVLLPYRQGGRWGFADMQGNLVVPASYSSVQPFAHNLAIVRVDSLYGVIDKHGREILPPRFSRIFTSECGIFYLRTPEGFVLMGLNGRRIGQGVYQKVYPEACAEGRILVEQDGKLGFLDSLGRPVTPFQYEQAYHFSHGVAPVMQNGKWGAIGLDGRLRVAPTHDALFPFTSGLGVGMEKDASGLERWGVLDSMGRTLIPFQFGRITGSFKGSHVAAAARDPHALFQEGIADTLNTWFIFDRKGNLTGETHYHLWDDFSEGLIVAERDGKFGFVDTTGRVAIPFRYDWACGFSMGMAWVKQGELYGFIDPNGKAVIPIRYGTAFDYVYMDEDGVEVVDPATGEHFFVDRNGKEYRAGK